MEFILFGFIGLVIAAIILRSYNRAGRAPSGHDAGGGMGGLETGGDMSHTPHPFTHSTHHTHDHGHTHHTGCDHGGHDAGGSADSGGGDSGGDGGGGD